MPRPTYLASVTAAIKAALDTALLECWCVVQGIEDDMEFDRLLDVAGAGGTGEPSEVVEPADSGVPGSSLGVGGLRSMEHSRVWAVAGVSLAGPSASALLRADTPPGGGVLPLSSTPLSSASFGAGALLVYRASVLHRALRGAAQAQSLLEGMDVTDAVALTEGLRFAHAITQLARQVHAAEDAGHSGCWQIGPDATPIPLVVAQVDVSLDAFYALVAATMHTNPVLPVIERERERAGAGRGGGDRADGEREDEQASGGPGIGRQAPRSVPLATPLPEFADGAAQVRRVRRQTASVRQRLADLKGLAERVLISIGGGRSGE